MVLNLKDKEGNLSGKGFNWSIFGLLDGENESKNAEIFNRIFEDIKNNGTKAATALEKELTNLTTSGKKLGQEIVDTGGGVEKISQGFLAASQSASKLTLASKAATLGMKALSMAMNMALIAGATWVIFEGIPKLIDALTTTIDEHREGLEELKSCYKSTGDELASVNSELETTGKRISELQDKLSLTFVEQEELSKLQGVTSELERQKGILEAQQKIEQAGVNKAFVDTMNASQNGASAHKYYSYEDSNNDGKQSVWEGINSGTVTYTDKQGYTDHQFKELETLNQQLIQAEEEYQAALESGNEKQQKTLSNRTSNYRDQIQKIKEELNKELKTLQSDSNGISYIENPTNEDEKTVNKWLDFIADFEDKIAIAVNGEGAKTVAFDRIINKEEFAEAKKELEELAASGNLTAEKLNDSKYEGLAKELYDVGISAEDASAQLNEMYASQDGHQSPVL